MSRVFLKQVKLNFSDSDSSFKDEIFEDSSSQVDNGFLSDEESEHSIEDTFIQENSHLMSASHSINPNSFKNVLSEITDCINKKVVYYTSSGYAHTKTQQVCNPKIEVSNFADDTGKVLDAMTLNEVAKLMNNQTKSQVEEPVDVPKEEAVVEAPVVVKRPTAKRTRSKAKKSNRKRVKTTKKDRASKMTRKDSSETKSTAEVFEEVKVPKRQGKMECKDCGKTFTAQGLGGHRAKAHPGQNQSYREKMLVRRENQDKREILRFAQYLYYQRYSHTSILVKDIPRATLQRLKKELEENPNMVEELRAVDIMAFLARKKRSKCMRPTQ